MSKRLFVRKLMFQFLIHFYLVNKVFVSMIFFFKSKGKNHKDTKFCLTLSTHKVQYFGLSIIFHFKQNISKLREIVSKKKNRVLVCLQLSNICHHSSLICNVFLWQTTYLLCFNKIINFFISENCTNTQGYWLVVLGSSSTSMLT